jgi:L-lactate permease
MPFGGTLSVPRYALVAVNDALRMELYPWGIHVALIEGGSTSTRAVDKLEAAAEATIDRLPVAGRARYADAFTTNWLSAAGTIILIGDIIALIVLRVGPGRALRIYGQSLNQLKWAILTIAAVLGLGFLLNYSAATYTLGLAAAATGVLFPFFAPIIGWLGVALTGSDTSSNALFANLQKVTAQQIGVSPNLTVGANSSGGVLGKMISPQNLAVGTSATGLQGKKGDLLRLVLKWSIGLTLVMSILVVLQAYVLKFMIPG